MITLINPHHAFHHKYAGLSTDTKPTKDVPNGSECREMDTSADFRFDEETGKWLEQSSGGGGANPNSIQTLTGTIVDVMTTISADDRVALQNAIISGDATAKIVIDATQIGMGTYTQYLTALDGYAGIWTNGASVSIASSLSNEITWLVSTGELSKAYIEQDGTITDMTPYASYVGASVTIYWHPMPE